MHLVGWLAIDRQREKSNIDSICVCVFAGIHQSKRGRRENNMTNEKIDTRKE